MPIVPAKCTQCGGNIEVNTSQELGVCKYCGMTFIIEKAINNYNTYISNVNVNIENYRILAQRYSQSGNIIESLEYYKKIIEFEPNDWESAFYIELYKPLVSNDCLNVNVDIIKQFSNNWIKKSNNSLKIKKEITEAIASLSSVIYSNGMDDCFSNPNAYDYLIKSINLYDILYQINLMNDQTLAIQYLEKIISQLNSGKKLLFLHEEYMTKTFGKSIMTEIDTLKDKYVREMLKYNPNYIVEKDKDSPSNSNQKLTSNGCYIATCVYGSYDCPEVWTLRRFRDYTLYKTWYGRLFIKMYYFLSPKIVKYFGKYNFFKKFFKIILNKIVKKLNQNGFDNHSYIDKY